MTLAPADMLCFALHSTAHAVHAAYAPLLQPLGLTYPQYLVLSSLNVRDDQTVGKLGGELRLESNTLTPLLKRMEAAGWLTRLRDTADERRVLIRLTPEGRALKARARRIPGCVLQAAHCNVDEVQALTRQVQALRDRLLG